jgi:hypothetical protein
VSKYLFFLYASFILLFKTLRTTAFLKFLFGAETPNCIWVSLAGISIQIILYGKTTILVSDKNNLLNIFINNLSSSLVV